MADEPDIEDMPETEREDGVTLDDAAPEGAERANSSDAQGDTEDTTLSLVRDVVGEASEVAAAASPAEGDEAGSTGDERTPKQDNENYSDVPFHKHPRFQQLVREKRVAEADATRYRNVEGFLQSNNVSAEEAAEALSLAARAKVDPAGTLEALRPLITDLLVRSGEALPPDLQQAVDQGRYTPDAAKEISRLRAAQQTAVVSQQHREQQTARSAAERFQVDVNSAVAGWENDRRQKDPNFEAKIAPLQREVAWIQVKEGKPETLEGVRDQLARAYKAVNEKFVAPAARLPAPRRQAIRPVTGGQVNGSAPRKAMNSTLDIVRAYTGGA